MRKSFGTALAAGVALSAMITQTAAGGYGSACYERVRSAPVYETVYEQVMVSPGGERVEHIPPVYDFQRRHVQIRPAQVSYNVIPAQYAYQNETVLIEPARTVRRVIPAITRTVHRKVLVDQGGYGWEWQWIDGRKVLCKIRRGAVYRTVAETVVVEPARVVHETIPARYGHERRRVLVSEPRRERYVIPAEYGYVTEKVLVRPAERRVHRTPPRFETVARRVQVSGGHESWRKVRIRGHCG